MTTITEICERPKLLASNSTIEGTRSGEMEKVFFDITKKHNELVDHTTKYQKML
jgi:hypothetical protein